MRSVRFLLAAAALVVFIVGGSGLAAAEPQKNEVPVTAYCDGEQYSLVLKGEGNAGHILDSTSNLIPVKYTVVYRSAATGEILGSDTFDQGNKTGFDGDLTQCSGETRLVDWRMGEVIATFDIQAHFTGEGNK